MSNEANSEEITVNRDTTGRTGDDDGAPRGIQMHIEEETVEIPEESVDFPVPDKEVNDYEEEGRDINEGEGMMQNEEGEGYMMQEGEEMELGEGEGGMGGEELLGEGEGGRGGEEEEGEGGRGGEEIMEQEEDIANKEGDLKLEIEGKEILIAEEEVQMQPENAEEKQDEELKENEEENESEEELSIRRNDEVDLDQYLGVRNCLTIEMIGDNLDKISRTPDGLSFVYTSLNLNKKKLQQLGNALLLYKHLR